MSQLKRKPRKVVRARDPSLGSIELPNTPLTESAERLFRRVAEEVMHGHRSLFDDLTAHEKQLVLEWLADSVAEGRAETLVHDVLWEVDYHAKPPTIEDFIHSDEYLGRVASELHPQWKEDLCRIFAPGSTVFEWILTGAIGIGKALGANTRVLTPHGWRFVREICVGDHLIGRDGRRTRVQGVYQQGPRNLFRVTFDDGATSLVDGDHLWSVATPSDLHRRRPWRVVATKDLARDVRTKAGLRWHVPVVDPVDYAGVDLPLPPYSVGALIGDGCLVSGGIRLSSMDQEIVEEVACELGLVAHPLGDGCDWQLSRERGDREGHPLLVLRDLGLCTKSESKRIPQPYLRASIGDRKRLLAGILDTDGWVQNAGSTTAFSTSSPGLADDVIELVRSLGGIARRTLKRTTHLDAHVLTIRMPFCPFLLKRKVAKWKPTKSRGSPRRMIAAIERAGIGDAICFKVDAADELFVIDDFVVTHNTTLACVAQAYKLCLMSCLRDPARYYGLLTDSLIIFGIYSITKRQVSDAGYFKLRGFLDSSPYFLNKYPRNRKIDSKVQFLRQKVQIVPGSQEMHALGLDLFAFMMDEVNFMRTKESKETGKMVGQAYDLYNATRTRLLSRFMRPGGTLPGMMILMSSRNSQTSFLEERLKQIDPKVTFVSDYPLWAVKPKHLFVKPRFTVEVGDRTSRSRVLKPTDKPRKDAKVLQIPGEYRDRFDEDVDQALRDLAGVATFNLSPLIRDRQSVFDAIHPDMVHPFSRDVVTVDYQTDERIDEFFEIESVCSIEQSVWKPKINPGAPRFIHIDIGLTEDGLGFAMGHPAGTVRNSRVNEDGTISEVPNPVVIMDLMLRIVPPPGSEIDLSKVRSFIVYLSKLFRIVRLTFDRFQSADSIQIMTKLGFEAGHLSVDRDDEAYVGLRSALFDRRLIYYEYAPFIDEVLDLERDAKERKVDHPVRSSKGGRGSKDVSDAVAGVLWHCVNDKRAVEAAAAVEIEANRERIQSRKQIVAAAKQAVAAERSVSVPGVGNWDALRRNASERL